MKSSEPSYIDLTALEVKALLERVKASMSAQDYELIKAVFETQAVLVKALEDKNISIGRLRRMLFGACTESCKNLFPDGKESLRGRKKKKKRKGHGRNGAEDYPGAQHVFIPHPNHSHGDPCPHRHCEGKLYDNIKPAIAVRFHGNPLISVTVFQLQRLRCNLCGDVFTAPLPPQEGEEKYDDQTATNISVYHYGAGLPFNRVSVLQEGLGTPLPASTQWEIVKKKAEKMEPVFEEMFRQAAQGKLFHNDDTPAKILSLLGDALKEDQKKQGKSRNGVFTSGVLSVLGDIKICLFFTGKQHAGEALDQVLDRRQEGLARPIQMSDALNRNRPKKHETIQANCNSHARRGFVDVANRFPDQSRHVIDLMAKVFKNDEITRKQSMSDKDRLRFHQHRSAPIMNELHAWLKRQLKEKLVEPNSGLGDAISYMLDHWKKLTLFLRKAGAPIHNNILERALKVPIRYRKNSYFYKTENGARVSNILMSFIHTCYLGGINPFDYLNALQKYSDEAARDPPSWMPWNYTKTVQALLQKESPVGQPPTEG